MDQNQFYPTPKSLAERAWKKFENINFIRVLEPSAGKGDLAKLRPRVHGYEPPVDCIEIDLEQHATLRDQGFDVVGIDFLQYEGAGAVYSHIILNPPFINGVDHVLKAWDILFDGEIVAILNAETIRNPHTKERRLLANLVEQHGSVEYIESAFTEAERKTEVEVALVHLRKKSNFNVELVGTILDGLKADSTTAESLAEGFDEKKELAVSGEVIRNTVRAYNAAVQATRESISAQATSAYYTKLLGQTLAHRKGGATKPDPDSSLEWVRNTLFKSYRDLKNRAWTGILCSTQVTSKLSSAAQKRLESEFQAIKSLEFTVSNIYGFLQGLSANQGQIQIDMACDVFDLITRYHTDNALFYKGWKSNDKHRTSERTCGLQIKKTRFIIPGHQTESYSSSVSWDTRRMLGDFDKIFAMLDGKVKPETSLEEIFQHSFDELRCGERVASSYFDVRYYPGAGTIHFFARDKKLVDRLNRLVGRQRRWLPPQDVRVSDAFWLQYDRAEKYDREFRKEIASTFQNHWDDPLRNFRGHSDRKAEAAVKIDEALNTVLQRNGINPDNLLEEQRGEGFKLLAQAA